VLRGATRRHGRGGCRALPLTKATGNPDKEREQLADVEFLVERLCRFTVDGPTLVVEYDGEEVGAIAAGRADRSLREGLLGGWRKGLPTS
jgi:hypothetical protein